LQEDADESFWALTKKKRKKSYHRRVQGFPSLQLFAALGFPRPLAFLLVLHVATEQPGFISPMHAPLS